MLGAGPTTLPLVTLDATHVHSLHYVAVFASITTPLHFLAVIFICGKTNSYLRYDMLKVLNWTRVISDELTFD